MKFLRFLLGRGCSHRFSWPRIDANGHYYQVCPDCGTAYEYDWTLMSGRSDWRQRCGRRSSD